MRLFGPLYDRALLWAAHRRAAHYLAALSFAEASFFPIPPDVMLLPMAVSRPNRWLRFALIATLASVVGAVVGYLVGQFALSALRPWLAEWGLLASYQQAVGWFDAWGVWVVLAAGFTPLPYKVFTLAAGALGLALVPFLLASLFGRGLRFCLVALLAALLGPRMEPFVRRWIEWLGWAALVVIAGVWLAVRIGR